MKYKFLSNKKRITNGIFNKNYFKMRYFKQDYMQFYVFSNL